MIYLLVHDLAQKGSHPSYDIIISSMQFWSSVVAFGRKWWAVHSPPFSLQGCHPTSRKDSLFQASKPAKPFHFWVSFFLRRKTQQFKLWLKSLWSWFWKTMQFPLCFEERCRKFLENLCPVAKLVVEKKTGLPALEPWKHFVPVKEDFSSLVVDLWRMSMWVMKRASGWVGYIGDDTTPVMWRL